MTLESLLVAAKFSSRQGPEQQVTLGQLYQTPATSASGRQRPPSNFLSRTLSRPHRQPSHTMIPTPRTSSLVPPAISSSLLLEMTPRSLTRTSLSAKEPRVRLQRPLRLRATS